MPDPEGEYDAEREGNLLKVAPFLSNLREFMSSCTPPLLKGTRSNRSPTSSFPHLRKIITSFDFDEEDRIDVADLSRYETLPNLETLEIYDWDEEDYGQVRRSNNFVLPKITSLKVTGGGADSTVRALVDACPSLKHLTLVPWTGHSNELMRQLLPHLPDTLYSLALTSSVRPNNPLDKLFPRFKQLRSLHLDDGSYTRNLHLALLQLPCLANLRLGNSPINLVGLRTLISGPSRLASLRSITLDCQTGAAMGERTPRPSNPDSDDHCDSDDYFDSDASLKMTGWVLPYSDWSPGSPNFDQLVTLIEVAKQNGVEIRGQVLLGPQVVEAVSLEQNNRAVVKTWRSHRALQRAQERARNAGWPLPPPEDEESVDNIEIIETELPERNWYILSLRRKAPRLGVEGENEV